jgi:hypothetical protein
MKRQLDRIKGPLPDFIILGTQRGGTTSLYDDLTRHPQIIPAAGKELHYFDNKYSKGVTWYRGHFSRRVRFKPWLITGEATPYYLFHPAVPDRVLETCPRAKFLVLLRDPVSRAYSHYHMMRKRDREPLSFEEALKAIELTDYAHRNRREYSAAIDPETERCLRDFYRPHNERLFALLGRDFPWK